MKAEPLEKIFYRTPFQPFRLVLNDGEEVTVKRPRKALVSGEYAALVGECRRGNGAGVERFRIIRLDRVASAENLTPPKSR